SNEPSGSAAIADAVARIERDAGGAVRLRVDRREGMRPGEKFAEWELRGVPLRIVAGAKDLADGNVTVVRRVDGQQHLAPISDIGSRLPQMLEEAQRAI